MKWFFSILILICSNIVIAQNVKYPAFDRTNTPRFSVERVNITSDTTFVFCTYMDEGHSSWISISKETFLEDVVNGTRYPLLKANGLPFSPEKRYYTDSINAKIILYFPSITTTKFNLIEEENSSNAFNIYGIDLKQTHSSSYTYKDIEFFFKISQEKEEQKDYQSAINYKLKQLEAAKSVCGEISTHSSFAMYDLTLNYCNIKEYEKMIEWGKKAIEILHVLPQDSSTLDVLARAYGSVGAAYQSLKQQEIAKQYMELSLATRRIIGKTSALNYEEYLLELADMYCGNGNYPKALLYGKEVADIYEKKFNDNKEKYGCVYVSTLSNLCTYYSAMRKHEEAIKTVRQAISLIENGACERTSWQSLAANRNYARELAIIGKADEAVHILKNLNSNNSQEESNNVVISSKILLGEIYLKLKRDTVKAINEFKSVLKIIEDSIAVGKKEYPIYTSVLKSLYDSYKDNDSVIALQFLKKRIQVQKQWNGEESVAYGKACLDYVIDQSVFGNALFNITVSDSLIYYLRQSSDIIKRQICNSVYNMSKDEREAYWVYYNNLYTWFIPNICGTLPNLCSTSEGAKGANSLAYDTALFVKGMLLSSEMEFNDVIQSSYDDSLKGLYKEYVNNISLLEEQYNSYFHSVDIDSLKSVIKKQEHILTQKVTRFNKLNKGTNYSWKEVQEKLKDEDVAIEIASYSTFDGSDTFYDAYVIDNKSITPIIIFMFYENLLSAIIKQDSIDYEGLYNLTWGNEHLYEVIKDKKNIYFSASGLLNSLGIEYLPTPNGQYICDKYNIYRLSSTRELCYSNNHVKSKRACLYGGLDYNDAKNGIVDYNNNNELHYSVSRAVADSILIRGGFDPLFGSKQEIDQINYELAKNRIHCTIYTESEGTEESFKKLSGNQINIIHLSTHGKYISINEEEKNKKSNFQFVILEDVPDIDEETQSLSRSFLVMSGGNKLIHEKNIQNNRDDGILTALEISHLDFTDLDLVVLSACETALGRIDTEGVYGLQRAFKKAGANTILMSLDKVDDEATRILMVEFYKNLMSGKTKLQSLRDAQEHLRKVKNGKYDNPKYWASFILLDGLN